MYKYWQKAIFVKIIGCQGRILFKKWGGVGLRDFQLLGFWGPGGPTFLTFLMFGRPAERFFHVLDNPMIDFEVFVRH
jgi:hypothetical protein